MLVILINVAIIKINVAPGRASLGDSAIEDNNAITATTALPVLLLLIMLVAVYSSSSDNNNKYQLQRAEPFPRARPCTERSRAQPLTPGTAPQGRSLTPVTTRWK